MKVKELVALLLKENQEADACMFLPYNHGSVRVISGIDRGWFLVDIPGQLIGLGVDEWYAKNAITTDNKPLLDLTSPCITDAVFFKTAKYING
jgi:hypothetical protein